MQIEVEKLEGLARRLKVVLPEERFETAYQERLKEIAKKTRLPGFRPGKAPLNIIAQRIGNTVRREVASELMQSGFQQAIVDHQLKIAGSPEVKPGEISPGKPLEFEVLYEAYPEIQLTDFSGVSIEKPVATVSDEDVDKALLRIQRQYANWNDVERPAKEGDRVIIDFEGFIDKKPFQGGSAKNYALELGSHEMIPGFEEALIGVTAGQARDVNVTFPENYPLTNLSNQAVLFKVEVYKVQEAQLSELDDDFAQKIGAKDAMSLTDLKQKTREGLQLELNRHLRTLVKKQVLDKLIELNPVETPQTMVNDEIKHLQDITRQQISMQQERRLDPTKIQLPHDPYVPHAKKRVTLGLLIAEIIKEHKLKVDKEKTRLRVEEIVSSFPNPEEMANYYQSNKRLMSEIESTVIEEQVVDKLLELANITERELSFDEAANAARQLGE